MGLVAAIGAFFVEWIVYSRICSFVSTHYRIFSVVSFGENALYMILAFLGIGLLAGVAGSLISLSKYLKED